MGPPPEPGKRMGEGRWKLYRDASRNRWGGAEGAFLVPTGSEEWEEAINVPSCVAYIAKTHLILVKQALSYLAFGIV